jgi:hypothetical protein
MFKLIKQDLPDNNVQSNQQDLPDNNVQTNQQDSALNDGNIDSSVNDLTKREIILSSII